jgi:hypothetical protein
MVILCLGSPSNSFSPGSSTSVDSQLTAQSGRLANPFLFANSILPVGIVTDRSGKIIMSSVASASPNEGSPPGIAVNAQGIVLTTLGFNHTNAGNFSVPVAFSVDFDPQNVTNSNRPLVLSDIDLSSRGMTGCRSD